MTRNVRRLCKLMIISSSTVVSYCCKSSLFTEHVQKSTLRFQVNCFRTIIATSPDDLLPTVYLCTNQVAPSHEGIELGIGDATLVKVCLAPMFDCLQQAVSPLSLLCQHPLAASAHHAAMHSIATNHRMVTQYSLASFCVAK